MKTPTLLVILALVALPAAGCIENMRDLKDRVTGAEQETGEALDDLGQATDELDDAAKNVTDPDNETRETKPPVARLSVFADGGALLFKSSFVGEDQTSPVFVEVKDKLTLNGADSEALEPGATLAKYEWTFNGQTLEGRASAIEMPETPGAFPLMLKVTDSLGKSDTQSIVLAIAPEPFDVVIEMETPQFVGVDAGDPVVVSEPVSVTFDVVHEIDGKMVNVQSAQVVVRPGNDCDVSLDIFAPDGSNVGHADDAWYPSSQTETVELGTLAPGTYTATVYAFSCVKPLGVPVVATITYIEVVEGLDAGDGHAHHH